MKLPFFGSGILVVANNRPAPPPNEDAGNKTINSMRKIFIAVLCLAFALIGFQNVLAGSDDTAVFFGKDTESLGYSKDKSCKGNDCDKDKDKKKCSRKKKSLLKDASTVTIYEQTTQVIKHTYSLQTLMSKGASFCTKAREKYKISVVNGKYLKIDCYRPTVYSGMAVGHNIAAVKLDGVKGYPGSVWANKIVSYSLGVNGIAKSVKNALGPLSQTGPYKNALSTYLGDLDSQLILDFVAEGKACKDDDYEDYEDGDDYGEDEGGYEEEY